MPSGTLRTSVPSLVRASLLALVSVGCYLSGDSETTSQSASGGLATTVDTIGDTVFVRSASAGAAAARLHLVPELRIGVVDGDERYLFGQIGLMRAAAQGSVVVWDRRLANVREYASDGTFRRVIGRAGGGPGEFRSVMGLAVLGDGRLLLLDVLQRRINVYDSTGVALTSWPINTRLVTPNGLFADTLGSVYVRDFLEDYDPRRARREGLVRLSSATGGVLDTLPLPEMPEASFVSATPPGNPQGSSVMNVVPFSAVGTWDLGPDGVVVSGTGEAYSITVHRVGAPQLRIERSVPAVPVHAAERAAADSAVTARMRRVNPSLRWNGPTLPTHKPFFRTIRVAKDGRIWVLRELAVAEDTDPGGERADGSLELVENRAYDIFEADGSFVGTADLPPHTEILVMNRDVAWGVERDSLGVPFIVRFRILSPE